MPKQHNAGFAYAAPILGTINADIGPDPNIQWVALVHPVGLSVGMVCTTTNLDFHSFITDSDQTIIGRLSDIFGRRYFFIVGAFLAMIGTLISALAINVNMLIVGSMIKALAAATQLSCYYTIGELIPSKYRYLMIGAINVWNLPGQGFAPVVAQSLVATRVGWRAVYFLLTAVNGASLICYCVFYHPPNFHQKHGQREKKMDFVKKFDYVGTLLYAAGLTMFLLGLSWGGTKYSWTSAEVLSFILIGFGCLVAFVCWELFMDLKEPLVPMSLFRHRPWVVSAILTGIGAGVYYAGASKCLSLSPARKPLIFCSHLASDYTEFLRQRRPYACRVPFLVSQFRYSDRRFRGRMSGWTDRLSKLADYRGYGYRWRTSCV